MIESLARETYYSYIDKGPDYQLQGKEDWTKILYELPQYVAKKLTPHVNQNNFENAQQLLDLFFEKEDFKDRFAHEDPTIRFLDVSPKHQQFQAFNNRIQFLQGGNKTGKSANGAKKVVDYIYERVPGARIKPSRKKGEPFQIWVCNETRNLLKEAVIQLKKFLKADSYNEIKGAKSLTDQILLTAPCGTPVEITMMPYEAGVKAFESGNIDLIWCDEPPPLGFFGAIWGRFTKTRGILLVTATTVQGDSQYLDQMINGEGPKEELYRMGLVEHVRMSVWDNMTLSLREIEEFVGGYTRDSWEYRSRVMGEYAEMEGLVFPGVEEYKIIDGETVSWHAYDPTEFTQEMKDKCARVDGLDYGRGVEFANGNLFLEEDGTIRYEAEIYQAGLEAADQARLMRQQWKEHGKPSIVVADAQIAGENHSHTGPSILQTYYSHIPMEETPMFRTEWSDKQDVQGSIAMLGNLLKTINPKTGKPMLRFNVRCRGALNEIKNLAWKPYNESSTQQKEYTKGKNHVIAFLRYLCKSGILQGNLMYEYHRKAMAALNASKGADPNFDGYINTEKVQERLTKKSSSWGNY